jgi:HD superfamily phosphodiesterase
MIYMKKNLSLNDSKSLLKKYIIEPKVKNYKFLYLHSKNVSRIAVILSKNKKANKQILNIAGLIHDIGYFISHDNHALHTIELLKKEGFVVNEKLYDCIMNHGNNGEPKTIEGKLLKIADKVSILDFNTIKIMLEENNYTKIKEEDINLLKIMSEKSIERLKEL